MKILCRQNNADCSLEKQTGHVLKFFAARFKNEPNPQQDYGPVPAEGKQLGVAVFTKRIQTVRHCTNLAHFNVYADRTSE